jgi:hypothetical protein
MVSVLMPSSQQTSGWVVSGCAGGRVHRLHVAKQHMVFTQFTAFEAKGRQQGRLLDMSYGCWGGRGGLALQWKLGS